MEGVGIAAEIRGQKERDILKVTSEAYKQAEELKGHRHGRGGAVVAHRPRGDHIEPLTEEAQPAEGDRALSGDRCREAGGHETAHDKTTLSRHAESSGQRQEKQGRHGSFYGYIFQISTPV